jgi:hypothetical protein
MVKVSKSDEAARIAKLELQVETLKGNINASKVARSKLRFDNEIAKGYKAGDFEPSYAATSTRRGTVKGEAAFWLLRKGPGTYKCAVLRKAITSGKEAIDCTASQLDAALDMLQKGFALRTLVGFTLDYDPEGETVSLVARKRAAPKAPKASGKSKGKAIVPVAPKADDAAA